MENPFYSAQPPSSAGSERDAFAAFTEHLPAAVAVFDAEMKLLRANPAWMVLLERFTGSPPDAACGLFSFFSGDEAHFHSAMRRAWARQPFPLQKVRVESGRSIFYWDGSIAPVIENGRTVAIVHLAADITERVQAEQQRQAAFDRLKENEATLRSLIDNAQHFAVYRVAYDPQRLSGGRLVFVSPSIEDITGSKADQPFETWFENLHPNDAARVEAASRHAMEHGLPYNETARVFHPVKKRWVFVHTISNPFFDAQGRLTHFDGMVIDLTDQMNLQQAEQQRRAAEGLREILKIINSNQPLAEILNTIAYQANELLQASSTMIRHVSLEEETVTTVACCNLPPEFETIRSQPFYRVHSDQLLMERQPVVTADIPAVYLPRLSDPTFTDPLQRAGVEVTAKYYQSMLKVPLFVKGKIYGAITLHYEQPHQFSEEDLSLAMTLADQAALAVENARLIDQVKETAVIEERNRLARELHDAVTQTLFSTTLTAEVLPRIWERNPADGLKKLDELRELTRGALAEMRTLLMELRPDALADAELKDLLRHLTNAFIARARIPVDLIIEGDCAMPLEVKIAFYRITQEALNNIAKHSDADRVIVSLSCQNGLVALRVADNGQGFDPESVRGADHYGLRIMRERAEQAGAALEITSQAGQGVQVAMLWRDQQPAPANLTE